MRLPRNLPAQLGGASGDAVQYEILQEVAATLARIGRRLEAALRALEEFDATTGETAHPAEFSPEREALVAAAGEALWYFVVQREVCGLRDTDVVMRELRVPRDVQLRMGCSPRPRKP